MQNISSRLQQAFDISIKYFKEGIEDETERTERLSFYQRIYSSEFNELIFSEYIKKLWAMRIWGNKDYIVQKMLAVNGFEKIESIFKYLSNKEFDLKEGYEKLMSIKYMGPSMATELLCYLKPNDAGLWNSRARISFKWLSMAGIVDKYRPNPDEYMQNNEQFRLLGSQFSEYFKTPINLLQLDYFLWKIAEEKEAEVMEKESKNIGKLEGEISTKSRHDELKDKVERIGSQLGFEVETEKLIATGAKIDIIWKAKIANLGVATYVFEVQDRGSIDSLILNLQKSQSNSTVQKLVVITDKEQIEKIKKEIENMPETFRKDIAFWDALDVDKTFLNLEQVTNSIAELKLVNDSVS